MFPLVNAIADQTGKKPAKLVIRPTGDGVGSPEVPEKDARLIVIVINKNKSNATRVGTILST